jgi:transposase
MSDTERMDMSKAGEVRRFEVFTGTGRRRRWPAEVKARIVAESYEEADTVSAVARRHGLTVQQLFAWRREYRERTAGAGAAAQSGFVPVVVTAGCAPAVREPMITIELCGARVHVPPGTEAAALQVELRAVMGLS